MVVTDAMAKSKEYTSQTIPYHKSIFDKTVSILKASTSKTIACAPVVENEREGIWRRTTRG